MEYEHGGWSIDPMPDFSLGKFFAHARIIRVSPECDADSETQVALIWAIDWISMRSANGRQTERPNFAQP
jgi:hypothetical protein